MGRGQADLPRDAVALGHHPRRIAARVLGVETGAEIWAMFASLFATCKMSGVNPVDYLADTLRASLDGHPKSGIEDIMPWHDALPSSLAA